MSVRMMKAALSCLMLAGAVAAHAGGSIAAVPEPGTYAMLGSGAAVLGGFLYMRFRANKK